MTTTRATTKKTTAKKAPAAKAIPAKKAVPAKATAKKKTVSKKAAAVAPVRSFRISEDRPAFATFQLSRQTVYWVILVSFIVFAQLWIIKLQVEVASILEVQQAELVDN